MSTIIVGGREVRCAAHAVVSWRQSGLTFPTAPLRESADLIVLDWTSSDARAPQAHKALRERTERKTGAPLNLSAQFFVDHAGAVYQWMDALARANAGYRRDAFRRGISILVANRADAKRCEHGIRREIVREEVNHEISDRTTFTAQQVRSTLALVEALCGALSIPFAVPLNGPHVITSTLSDAFLASYRGALGAYHLDPRHRGPGLALLRAIAAKPCRAASESGG